MRLGLEHRPDEVGEGGVNSGSERTPGLIDQDHVVGVKPRDSWQLVLLESDDDALDLFALNGHQNAVAELAVAGVRLSVVITENKMK